MTLTFQRSWRSLRLCVEDYGFRMNFSSVTPGRALALFIRVLVLGLALALLAGAARSQPPEAAIASAHPLATAAGYQVLERGGNAFDAAVAVSAALAVVEPYSSGLGGGGFWLIHRAADGFETMVDGRESAPLAAHSDMYLDPSGKPVSAASLTGARAAAIPGTPAALAWIASRYGRLPLAVSLGPAIVHAEQGFAVDDRLVSMVRARGDLLRSNPEAARLFLPGGRPPAPGTLLVQPELAQTLKRLAMNGRDGFYAGVTAQILVASVRAGGGIWQMDDLARYQVKERAPVKIRYGGARITTAALPSAAGLTLAQALHILERFPLQRLDQAARAHLVVEALRRGFEDRARHLGDPDFVSGPWQRLQAPGYGAERARSIDLKRAGASDGEREPAREGTNTTHFSIVDRDGNRVAATLTINTLFGSGFVAAGSGVLLNNEMDDFSVAPGVPNAYGLVGSSANAIAPGKRPLSSMAPTFVEDERGVLVLGTPGGSRIISMVLLAILDHLARPEVDLQRLVAAPRFHHQFLPDRIEVEPGAFAPDWITALQARGHRVEAGRRLWGNMQAVFVPRAGGRSQAASDPRGLADGMAWY